MMHFWSKFGKPHFIWFWLIARTNSQAQNGVNLDFQAQFDLEDHCQSPHKTIGILIKVFYISDPNLVILAWTVDELSHGQAHDWRTHRHIHTHTHAGNDNTRRPKLASGKNGLFCFQPRLGLFAFSASCVAFLTQLSESDIAFSLPKKLSRFWLRFPCQHIHPSNAKSSLEPYSSVDKLLSRSTYVIYSRLLEIVTQNNTKHKHGYRFLSK